MNFPRPANAREHDLLLLAKRHYRQPDELRIFDAARRIICIHNWVLFDRISDGDVAHVVLGDLLPFLQPRLSPDHWKRMLLEMGPGPLLGGHIERDGGYYPGLVAALLAEATRLRIRTDDGQVLLELPPADPAVAAIVAATDCSPWMHSKAA